MKLPRLQIAPVSEVTFAELMRALAGEVAEADATFQLRQRLAWRDATGGASAVLEGLDRMSNLGLQQVRLSFQLEPAPQPWYARLWDVLTERLGRGWLERARAHLAARGGLTFRFARPGHRARAAPALQVSISVGREPGGAWESTIEGLPPGIPAADVPVPALGA